MLQTASLLRIECQQSLCRIQAVGPGCPLISNGHVTYDLADGELYANVTCSSGASQVVHCVESTWSDTVECFQPTAAVG